MYGFVITTAGEGLLARAAAGEGLTLTGVKFGSGAVASAAAAKALTALISEKAAGTSSAPAVSGGQLSLIAEYRNDLGGGLATGFTLSEFGIFAKVGDDAPALLYYAALGDKAQPVQPISEGLDVHRFPVAVGVTGEVAVTLSYPAGAWVTSAQLEESLQEIDLSGYVPKTRKVNGKALSGDITLTAADVEARPSTWTPTAADVGAAAVNHNHSAGEITSGTLSSARLPVVPISKGGTGKTTAAEALAALGGASAASLADYDKTIKGTYPIATGNSVTAGDVVDVVDGEVTLSLIVEPNVTKVFESQNNISGLNLLNLNQNSSVALYGAMNQANSQTIINTTGHGLGYIAAASGNTYTRFTGTRLTDSSFVMGYAVNGGTGCIFRVYANGYFRNQASTNLDVSPTPAAVRLADNKFVVVSSFSNGGGLFATIGTVDSSFNIIWSSQSYCGNVATATVISAALLPDNTSGHKRVCVCFVDSKDNAKGKAVIATINSSNAVTWGSVVTFNATSTNYVSCAAIGDKVAVSYVSNNVGYSKLLSINGSTISTTSPISFSTATVTQTSTIAVGNKFVVSFGKNGGYSRVLNINGSNLTSGPEYKWANGFSNTFSTVATDANHFMAVYCNLNDGYGTSTILEVNGNQIAGGFMVNSTQAIALESGEAGQEIEVIFAGTTAADFATEGQAIPSDGVYGYGPMAGWLNVIPYWAKEAGVRIATGSYVGTGKSGASNPNSLTFPFEPKFIYIYQLEASSSSQMFCGIGQTNSFVSFAGTTGAAQLYRYASVIDLSGKQMSWWNDSASAQLNGSGEKYLYLIIG